MTKKQLSLEIDLMGGLMEAMLERVHKLESYQGTIPHLIKTAVSPIQAQVDYNANLSKLMCEYLNITFYEIPAQEAKIEVRKKEKVSDNNSKGKSRQSSSKLGKTTK